MKMKLLQLDYKIRYFVIIYSVKKLNPMALIKTINTTEN